MGQNLTIVCINKRCKKFFHLGRMSLMSQKAFLNKQLKENTLEMWKGFMYVSTFAGYTNILTNLDGVQVIGSIIVISKIVIRNVVVVIVVVVIVVALV